MPDAWTEKDERMYNAIRRKQKEDGKSADLAKEIAARTVNKQRRLEGRTPQKSSQGTGNPHSSLESRSKQELLNRARALDIPGRSTMRKQELIDAIRDTQNK